MENCANFLFSLQVLFIFFMGCCLITDIHTLGTQKKGHKKIKTKKITLETLAYDNLMTCM